MIDPDPPYIMRPAWLAALVTTLCLGFSASAVVVRPHDAVARGALFGAVVVSVLMALLLRTEVIELRRVGAPSGSAVAGVVPAVAYFVAADVAGGRHGALTRLAISVDALGAALIVVGLVRTRRRDRSSDPGGKSD